CKTTVRPLKSRDQAPNRNARYFPLFTHRAPGAIESLPGERSTLVPRHAFGPSQQRFAPGITGHGRMLAGVGAARGRDRRAGFTGHRIDPREVDLLLGFPRGQHSGSGLGKTLRTHYAVADVPF